MEDTVLSWTPVRNGSLFCSPACGRGCTSEEHHLASAVASATAAAIGWRAEVWENLGWHWAVVSPDGRLKVHPGWGGGFLALLGTPGPGGCWSAHGRTVQEAVTAVVTEAKNEVAALAKLVEGL